MKSFIKDLSRPVLVYKNPATYECPNCYYDRLTDTSTNTCKWTLNEAIQKQIIYEAAGGTGVRFKYFARGRCPVCKGTGKLSIQRKVWVNCKITWDPTQGSQNNLTFMPAGFEGATVVELKTDPKNIEVFSNSTKIVVDEIECLLSKPPSNRGIGNEVVLVVTAFSTDKLIKDKVDIIKSYSTAIPKDLEVLSLENNLELLTLADDNPLVV